MGRGLFDMGALACRGAVKFGSHIFVLGSIRITAVQIPVVVWVLRFGSGVGGVVDPGLWLVGWANFLKTLLKNHSQE